MRPTKNGAAGATATPSKTATKIKADREADVTTVSTEVSASSSIPALSSDVETPRPNLAIESCADTVIDRAEAERRGLPWPLTAHCQPWCKLHDCDVRHTTDGRKELDLGSPYSICTSPALELKLTAGQVGVSLSYCPSDGPQPQVWFDTDIDFASKGCTPAEARAIAFALLSQSSLADGHTETAEDFAAGAEAAARRARDAAVTA